MTLPICIFLFLRLQVQARTATRKVKITLLMSYLLPAAVLFVTLFFAQIAANQRNAGFAQINTQNLSLIRIEGNSMFSAPLAGLELIPAQQDPFYSRFVGENVVTVLPYTAWNFVTHFIPRALWTSKPIDPVFLWYNELITGRDGAETGTNIVHGFVGGWYFRWGTAGVIQGALLFGFIALLLEKVLRLTWGRVLSTMLVLAFLVAMFRMFREVRPLEAVPAVLATVFFAVVNRVLRAFGL
jgi:hypothetical protein